jgi:hypothetical protein
MTAARCARSRSVFALLGVVVGAILLAGSGAGCIAEGAGEATFAPMMPARHDIAPITHLLVALIGGVDDDWRSGIESGLARQIVACGVRSTVLTPERLELAFLDRARRTAEQIQASAMLTIECKRSEAFEDTTTTTTRRALIFELMVIEPRSSEVVWRVESKLTLASHPSTSDSATAARFAASIVSRLQADQVLTGCPAPSKDRTAHAALPPCERLRREASAIADPEQPCRR